LKLIDASDVKTSRAADRVAPVRAGIFQVFVHGSHEGFLIKRNGKEEPFDHKILAREIRKAGWAGEPIVLYSCNTGFLNDGAAQRLANELKTSVRAPTDILWVDHKGGMTIGPRADWGWGMWRTFSPQAPAGTPTP
jgi:hypothetical protein